MENYFAVFHEDDKGYWVEFPDLPGCLTQGESKQKALDMAKDALGLYLDNNFDVKSPSSYKDIEALYPNELIMSIECNLRS